MEISQSIEITSPQKPIQITEKLFNNKVMKAYEQLQAAVDNMDDKVELVMRKHESQFLYAYRTHIKKIKKQLEQIKRKTEEQEKIFSANDRIRYLEKQISVFRAQAIKIYDKLQKQGMELSALKQKLRETETESLKNIEQKTRLQLQLKIAAVNQTEIDELVKNIQADNESKNERIRNLQKRLQKYTARDLNWKQIRANSSKSTFNDSKSQPKQFKIYRNELQEWFLECIKSVKKQIHLRKKGESTLHISSIKSITQFRLVDKLRLFQLFLENEKLLNWFYHKIFPDRMDSISLNLLNTPRSDAMTPQNVPQNIKTERYRYVEQINPTMLLPKVKDRKSQIRNSINIKNGKMTLSMLN